MARPERVIFTIVFLASHVRGNHWTQPVENCHVAPVVLEDVALGWADSCLGLEKVPDVTLAAACKDACVKDVTCGVWQLIGEGSNEGPQCYMGTPSHACRGAGQAANAGQRLQHGSIRVHKEAKDVHVTGLKHYVFSTGTEVVNVKRCQQACYSDFTCGVWQYSNQMGKKGCWVEHGPDNYRKEVKEIKADYIQAGEFIEHYCPDIPVTDEGTGITWEEMLTFCGLVLLALFCLFLICCICLRTRPTTKKTRVIAMDSKTEDEEDSDSQHEEEKVVYTTWFPQTVVEYFPQSFYSAIPQAPIYYQSPPMVAGPPSTVVEEVPLLVNQGQFV